MEVQQAGVEKKQVNQNGAEEVPAVSRLLFSKLKGLYNLAKTNYLPASANASFERLENRVVSNVTPIVSSKLAQSLEKKFNAVVSPPVDHLADVANVAGGVLTNAARPHVELLEKKILFAVDKSTSILKATQNAKDSTYAKIVSLKKNIADKAGVVKDSTNQQINAAVDRMHDRAQKFASDSLKSIDSVVDYILPEDVCLDTDEDCEEVTVSADKKDEGQDPDFEQLDQIEIDESVQRSVALANKVNKRLQKRVWARVASAQGFVRRKKTVIYTSLVDYAAAVVDRTVPAKVQEATTAIYQFPFSAFTVYCELAKRDEGADVDQELFLTSLMKTMGESYLEMLTPAAFAFVQGVNYFRCSRSDIKDKLERVVRDVQNLLDFKVGNFNMRDLVLEQTFQHLLEVVGKIITSRIAHGTASDESTDSQNGISNETSEGRSNEPADETGQSENLDDPNIAEENAEQPFDDSTKSEEAVEEDYVNEDAVNEAVNEDAVNEVDEVQVATAGKLIDIPALATEVYQDVVAAGEDDFDTFAAKLRALVENRGVSWAETLDNLARRVYDKLACDFDESQD